MMKKKIVLGSFLSLVLVQADCLGMKESESMDDATCKKLIVYGKTGQESQRRHPGHVSQKEKDYAVKIINMEQFREVTINQAEKLNSVTFCGVAINEDFTNKFEELFASGVDELIFENCHAVDGYSIPYLFDSLYQVVHLKIIGCKLGIQDAETILSLVSPYVIRTIDLSGNGLSKQDVFFNSMINQWIANRVCLDYPILCTP